MSSNIIELPSEIHDLIVDELGLEDDYGSREALRSCLFVSRSFRNQSRRYLFKDIRLDHEWITDLFASLELLLDIIIPLSGAGAGIARYIQSFSTQRANTSGPDLVIGVAMFSGTALPRILNALRGEDYGVSTLQVGVYAAYVNWSSAMSLEFKQALHTILKSPFLKDLSLLDVADAPFEIFGMLGSNLKTLTMNTVRFSDLPINISTPSNEITRACQLHTLKVSNTKFWSVAPRLQGPPPWSHLKVLNVFDGPSMDVVTAVNSIMSTCRHTIESVTFSFYTAEVAATPSIDFSLFPELRYLKIEQNARRAGTSIFSDDILESFTKILDTAKPAIKLQHLDLRIRIPFIDAATTLPNIDRFRPETIQELQVLDTKLTGHLFQSLRTVIFSVIVELENAELHDPESDSYATNFRRGCEGRLKAALSRLSLSTAITLDVLVRFS